MLLNDSDTVHGNIQCKIVNDPNDPINVCSLTLTIME